MMEKIGISPDIKSMSNSRREVGRERRAKKPSTKKDLGFLTQDAKKGTPVAGKQAPIHVDQHSITKHEYFVLLNV